jgi:dCTP deaminase
MTVYSDSALRLWAAPGGVAPYDPAMINPASIDLRLGNTIRVPRTEWNRDTRNFTDAWRVAHWKQVRDKYLEKGESPYWTNPEEFTEHVLFPGDCALCCSAEYIRMPVDATGMLFLKSSMGRILLEHSHSAFIDPGFEGILTLEVFNTAPWPIMLQAGKPTVQICLLRNDAAPLLPYGATGHYMGQVGPTVAWNETPLP